MENGDDDGGMCLSCKVDSAKPVATVLSCITGSKREQQASCEIGSVGMTFTVTSRAKSIQAQCHLKKDLFQAYHAREESIQFRINLSSLLECLSIFGSTSLAQTSLSMSYDSDEACFSLLLEDQGIITACEIRTLSEGDDDGDTSAFAELFRQSVVKARAIIKSDILKDAFAELSELSGASTVTILLSPQRPFFRLSASGSTGSCDIELPKDSEAFVEFGCDQKQEWRYRLSSLQQAMKALVVATETYIRVNSDGVLCVQHIVQSKVGSSIGHNSFVDFLICPDEDDEDE